MQGFTRMITRIIFRTCEKIPGILRMASKSYFFSEETPKGLFSPLKTKLYLVDDSGSATPVLNHASKA